MLTTIVPWFDWDITYDGEEEVDEPNWFGDGIAYINCNDFNGNGVFSRFSTVGEKYFMCTAEIRFDGWIHVNMPDLEQVNIISTGTAYSYKVRGDDDPVFEARLIITGADEGTFAGTRPKPAKCAQSQISSASGIIVLSQFQNGTGTMTIEFK